MAQVTRTLAATALLAVALSTAACGKGSVVMAPGALSNEAVEAQATATLTKLLTRTHQALFAMIDKDSNKAIDEYEAGPKLSLSDFQRADKNKNGKLTYSEFSNYGTQYLFFFNTTKKQVADRFRKSLAEAFHRLDTNRDGVLTKTNDARSELSLNDLRKLGLSFEYPRLHVSVKLTKFSPEMVQAADKTGDGVLGQAEFEDLYVEAVFAQLGGNPAEPPAPPAPAPGGDTPAPAPAPGGNDAPAADPAAPPAEPAPPAAPPAKGKK